MPVTKTPASTIATRERRRRGASGVRPCSNTDSRTAAPMMPTMPAASSSISRNSTTPVAHCMRWVRCAMAGTGTAIVPLPWSPSTRMRICQEPVAIIQTDPVK